jgi:hypothetical protein
VPSGTLLAMTRTEFGYVSFFWGWWTVFETVSIAVL